MMKVRIHYTILPIYNVSDTPSLLMATSWSIVTHFTMLSATLGSVSIVFNSISLLLFAGIPKAHLTHLGTDLAETRYFCLQRIYSMDSTEKCLHHSVYHICTDIYTDETITGIHNRLQNNGVKLFIVIIHRSTMCRTFDVDVFPVSIAPVGCNNFHD